MNPAPAPASPAAARSAERIADVNRQLGELLGDYIRENANGETPVGTPTRSARATPPAPRGTPAAPFVIVRTPPSATARRRLFADGAPEHAPRSGI